MSERTLRLFRERLERHELTRTKIDYRIVGGQRNVPERPPLPPIDEILTVEGDGTARLRSGELVVGEARLEAEDVATVFEQVGANLPDLVPRSEARFLPDSVLGEITVEVDDDRQQFYFLIEPEPEPPEAGPPELARLGDLRSRLRELVDQVQPSAREGVPRWP